MATPGPGPKGVKIGHSPTLDWTEVANKPFRSAKRRDLPAKITGDKTLPEVKRWWAALRVMPHCVLWTESDWLFAFDTAVLKQSFYVAPIASMAAEVRRREDVMGTTVEARRKLRIRYVDFVPPSQASRAEDRTPTATVTNLESRRSRLADA